MSDISGHVFLQGLKPADHCSLSNSEAREQGTTLRLMHAVYDCFRMTVRSDAVQHGNGNSCSHRHKATYCTYTGLWLTLILSLCHTNTQLISSRANPPAFNTTEIQVKLPGSHSFYMNGTMGGVGGEMESEYGEKDTSNVGKGWEVRGVRS